MKSETELEKLVVETEQRLAEQLRQLQQFKEDKLFNAPYVDLTDLHTKIEQHLSGYLYITKAYARLYRYSVLIWAIKPAVSHLNRHGIPEPGSSAQFLLYDTAVICEWFTRTHFPPAVVLQNTQAYDTFLAYRDAFHALYEYQNRAEIS